MWFSHWKDPRTIEKIRLIVFLKKKDVGLKFVAEIEKQWKKRMKKTDGDTVHKIFLSYVDYEKLRKNLIEGTGQKNLQLTFLEPMVRYVEWN